MNTDFKDSLKQVLKRREMNILAIIIVVSIIVAMLSRVFLTPGNLIYLVKNNLVMWILSLGMLLVIISGGIDVSIAANITTATVAIGLLLTRTQTNIVVVILLACAVGAAIGAINGFIIAKLKIPAIITTLSTSSIINGLILMSTNGNWITNLPQWFKDFGKISLGILPDGQGGTVNIPIQFLFLLFAIILTWFVLKYTLIGRGVYAIGGNLTSAQRVGYKPDRITIFIYAYIGFLAGLAAVAHTSIMEQVDPNAFVGTEMMVVAAVVIGGASVLGGTGTVLGTVLGSILVAVLNNGMVLAKVPTFWQKIVLGLIIVFALSSDMIQRKREVAKLAKVDVD